MSTIEKPITEVFDPYKIAGNIRTAWGEFVAQDRIVPAPHPYVYASSYRECVLQMVRDMTEPEKQAAFKPDTLANFRRGSDRERDLLADLKRIGRNSEPSFEVIGEQERFQLKDRKGRVAISGKVDARLKFGRRSTPLEVKSWNPATVGRIRSFDDLFGNRWTRSGSFQLLAYMFGANEPYGFMMLDRPGIPLLLPVELNDANLERLEKFLQRAEEALDHMQAGTLPDFHDDPAECKYCPYYGRSCDPPLLHGAGAKVLVDPLFLQDLERWYDLKPSAKEFKTLDDEIKERLRGTEMAIAGPFAISGKYGKSTSYELPEDVKAKYAKVDPKGSFRLTITRTEERDVQF